ncbi:acetyltransferase [Ornithinibacillus xuwenensis]|uniref:Acetyltransferase n=1 Tax=Ornithinibacillus xuwenensis TaxID=3144668 RepID=A0ABU9XK93_9BACI
MNDILLIGGGGHCKSVIDTLENADEFNIIGILDQPEKIGSKVNGIEIIGIDEDLPSYFEQGVQYAFITIGSVGNVSFRKSLYEYAKTIGYRFPTIIDKSAIISSNTELHEGCFIGKGAILNTNVSIGINSIINTGTIIEHDCTIGEFCHIAPGSTLSGSVQVGHHTHIGTNSTIIQNINIGHNSLIGAGSVVINNIENHKKAYGNPCKVVDSH